MQLGRASKTAASKKSCQAVRGAENAGKTVKTRTAVAERRLLHAEPAATRNYSWAYDFVEDRMRDGRKIRMLTVMSEFTRECLAIKMNRHLNIQDVLAVPRRLFLARGVRYHIPVQRRRRSLHRSCSRSLAEMGVKTLCMEPGSPWGRPAAIDPVDQRQGLTATMNPLTGSCGMSVLIWSGFIRASRCGSSSKKWRRVFNAIRPISSLDYRSVDSAHAVRKLGPDQPSIQDVIKRKL